MREVERELLFGVEKLEPLDVGFKKPVLDAVVHHLGEVTGSGRTDAFLPSIGCGGKRRERRTEALGDDFVSCDHRRVPAPRAGDSFARATVETLEPAFRERSRPPHGVLMEGATPRRRLHHHARLGLPALALILPSARRQGA